jgi:hypothetical protein
VSSWFEDTSSISTALLAEIVSLAVLASIAVFVLYSEIAIRACVIVCVVMSSMALKMSGRGIQKQRADFSENLVRCTFKEISSGLNRAFVLTIAKKVLRLSDPVGVLVVCRRETEI